MKSYNRLTSLVPLKYSLHGDYSNVRPGDCIVTFSRNKIFQIRKQIEQTTRQPCALVYGGLPAGACVCVYVYIYMYVCLYVCMHVCM